MSALEIAVRVAKHFESCATVLSDKRVQAYWDKDGAVWTIGWGSTGADIKQGTIWTQAQCDAWIEARMAKDLAKIQVLIAGLSDCQYGALGSLVYNIGMGNFIKSTLLIKVRMGKLQEAADQFSRWDKSGGKVLKGLTRRRKCEREIFLGKPLSIIEIS